VSGSPTENRVDDATAKEYSPPPESLFTIPCRERISPDPCVPAATSAKGFLGG
jgi:hypothetical protein